MAEGRSYDYFSGSAALAGNLITSYTSTLLVLHHAAHSLPTGAGVVLHNEIHSFHSEKVWSYSGKRNSGVLIVSLREFHL